MTEGQVGHVKSCGLPLILDTALRDDFGPTRGVSPLQ